MVWIRIHVETLALVCVLIVSILAYIGRFVLKISQDSSSIEAMCSLALSRSDSRLESFRISKFSPSAFTSSEPEAVESVDLGEHDPLGLGTNGVEPALGIEAKWSAATCCRAHVQKSVL